MSMFRLQVVILILLCSGCASQEYSEVGDRAPNFDLPTVNSEASLSLNSSEGRPVILNFWSSTCSACLKELPDLNQLHKEGGVTVIGIALDEDSSQVKQIVEDKAIEFDVVLGTQQLFEQYEGYGIPYTLVLDKNKTIRKRFRGIATHQELVETIQQIEATKDTVALN